MNPTGQLVFGPYCLDCARGQLLRGRQVVHVTPKALGVLEFLARNAERLVTKEELLQAIWADSLVTDASLKVCIREIRKALHDSPEKPRYIETAHRRGYRFVARVQSNEHGSSDASGAAAREVEEQSSVMQPGLVGREAELEFLRQKLEAARRGQRQLVFITGEPGCGKSTLVEAFLLDAERQGARVTAGQCFEQFGRGEAYLPLLEALGHLEQAMGRDALAEAIRKHAPAWLAQSGRGAQAERHPTEVLGATAERVLRELAELLEALAAAVPLVLLLEDMHWVDYSTLDLLSALARRRTPARLLVVATYRPVDVILNEHPLRGVKQELLAHKLCTEMPLAPLSEAAVAAYLCQRFPGQSLAEGVARQLHERTDGLPLFLVHLVDYLVSHQVLLTVHDELRLAADLARLPLEVPEGVRPLIEKQIDQLSPEEHRLLEGASVAGEEFAAATLARALELDVVEVEDSCEALVLCPMFLETRGVSEWPDGTVSTRYRFRHDLYHAAFSRRVSAARRGRLHLRVGESLEAAYGNRANEIAAELALHFEEARDHRRAFHYLRVAAQRAVRHYANREALDYLHRALEQMARLPAEDQDAKKHDLLELRGLVRRASNDMAGAAEDFEALAAAARRQGSPEVEARSLIYLASVVSWVDRSRCLRVADELIALSPRQNSPLWQAHARGQGGFFKLLMRGWEGGDAEAVRAAAGAARAAGDHALLQVNLRQWAFLQALQTQYAAATASAAEAAQLAQAHGDASEYLVSRFFQAWAQMHEGNWGAMLVTLREAAQIAEENGHRRWVVMFRYGLAWLSLQVYDFEHARVLIEHSLQEVKVQEFPYGQLIGPILLGFAHLGLHNLDAAGACFESMATRLERERLILDWVWWMLLRLGRAEYWLKRKEYAHARREAEALCALAAQPGERTYVALGHRVLAVIAAARNEWAQAEASLAEAVAAVEDLTAPLAAVPVYATAARLHAARQRPRDAAAAQSRSEAIRAALLDALQVEPPFGQSFASGQSVLEY